MQKFPTHTPSTPAADVCPLWSRRAKTIRNGRWKSLKLPNNQFRREVNFPCSAIFYEGRCGEPNFGLKIHISQKYTSRLFLKAHNVNCSCLRREALAAYLNPLWSKYAPRTIVFSVRAFEHLRFCYVLDEFRKLTCVAFSRRI